MHELKSVGAGLLAGGLLVVNANAPILISVSNLTLGPVLFLVGVIMYAAAD